MRRLAAEEGLVVADKPDSQDICFVPDGDYASLVKKLRPETAAPGEIVHVDGRVLGAHEGVVHFTIGQRRGIEVGGQPEPLYVVRIDPEERKLVVGPRRALAVAAARVEGVNWLAEDQVAVEAKVRSLARAGGRLMGRRAPDLRHARIWRRARPVGGLLRRRAPARRRDDRRDGSGSDGRGGRRRSSCPQCGRKMPLGR